MLTSRFTFTLLFYISLSLTLTASHASFDLHHRSPAHRLVKRRPPLDQGNNNPVAIGAGADPASLSPSPTSAVQTPSVSSQVPSPTNVRKPPPPQPPPAAPPTSSAPVLSSSTTTDSVSTTASTSSIQSSSSSTSSIATAAPSSAVTSDSLNLSALPAPSFTESVSPVIVTSTAAPAAASSTSPPTSSSGSTKHTTTTVLIIIASGVAGVALIWTVIRKWKFRPSSQFEDRMQPIDWQPTAPEEGLPGHRRMGSNASSFLSGSGHDHFDNMAGRGVGGGGGYGATSDITPSAAPLPDHDFTAGPANLAPVGGYADLARGPSPQPQMQESIARGPSLHGQQYDQFGAPQGYARDAYDYNGRAAAY